MAWQTYDSNLLNELASQLETRAKTLRDAAASLGSDTIEVNQSLSKDSALSKGLRFILTFTAEVTTAVGNVQLQRMGETSNALVDASKKTKGAK